MKKLILSVCLLPGSACCFSQSQIGLPQVIQPGPTAMQFHKYGDYPVNHFTGVPDITIPLYTIKVGDLELPVTMRYHASGIKVSEPTGFFGSGWTLHTGGGLISQTQVGSDNNNQGDSPPFKSVADLTPITSSNITTLNMIERGSTKSEYDLYSYNIGSNYGKFILKGTYTNRTAVLFPYKPIKIKAFPAGYQTFDVVDEKGWKYGFGNRNGAGAYDTDDGAATWLASHIVSPTRRSDSVSFRYTSFMESRVVRNERIIYDDYANDVGPLYVLEQEGYYSWRCNVNGGEYSFYDLLYRSPDVITDARSEMTQSYHVSVPQEIRFANGRIQFTYNATTHKLAKMEIFNTANQLLRSIEFTITPYTGRSSSRYKLEYIKFYDGQHNFINQYHLLYQENYMEDYRDCNGIDFWGYYNGKGVHDLLPRWDNFNVQPGIPGNYVLRTFGSADRTSNESSMKSCMLHTIEYPTGGKTVFDFESNKYAEYSGGYPILHPAGGLRIKTITNYTSADNVATVKNYTYGNNEDGGGFLEVPITRENFYYTQVMNRLGPNYFNLYFNYRRTVFLSTSLVDLAPHGNPVIYPKVIEYVGDATTNTGKTVYHYDYTTKTYEPYTTDQIAGWEGFPFNSRRLEKYIKDWMLGGEPLSTEYYKKNGAAYQLVQTVENEYEEYIRDSVRNLLLYRTNAYEPSSCTGHIVTFPNDVDYAFAYANNVLPFAMQDYYYISGEKRLKRTINRTASQNGINADLVTTTEYTYGNAVHLQPTSITTTNSKGELIKTELQYAANFQSIGLPVYDSMVSRHIWSPVIEQKMYKGNSFLQSIKNNYTLWPNNIIAIGTVESKTKTDPAEVRIRYTAYDDNGNIVTVSKENDSKLSHVWGYNNTLPIAQVVNAGANNIFHTSFEEESGSTIAAEGKTGNKSKLLSFQKSFSGLTNGPYVLSWWTKGSAGWAFQSTSVNVTAGSYTINIAGQTDEVRFHPANAQMITYTYNPLKGATTTTDINNRITYYEYDDAGRLQHIRDEDRNILTRYCYNYLGQNINCGGTESAPLWQNTGVSRKMPCPQNSNYLSCTSQVQQRDNNPASLTYNQLRWIDTGTSEHCNVESGWQNTATPLRCRTVGGQNTGEQEQEQINVNPCHEWFNQTRWKVIGTNTTACPVPSVYTSEDVSGEYARTCNWPDYGTHVYVSVPAGMFTSTISVGHANNQAYNYAYNYANQHGQCITPPIMLTFENNTQITSSFYVELYDSNDQLVYSFHPNDYFLQDMGQIAPGTYNIRMYTDYSNHNFTYYAGCDDFAAGNDVWLYDVVLDHNCYSLSVYE